MKNLKLYHQLFIRLLLLLLVFIGSFLLLYKSLIYTSIFGLLIFFLMGMAFFSFLKNTFLFYDKTIAAILNQDFSADFSKNVASDSYKNLFRLYDHLKQNQNEQVSKDLVYRSILNNIETGVLILQKIDEDWHVFLMNEYFSSHFKVPKVSKWKYLKNQLPSLCEIIEDRNFDEMKTSLQIRVNQEEAQTFMLQSSKSKTYDQEYYIILLDSIQKVVEKKEKEAWINLMKVISHELMNSITPIRSLTQNLNEMMQQEALSKEDLDDIKASISTMIHRSNHLQNFVESYRKIAMLPSPKKEKTALNHLIQNALNIMQPLFKNQNVVIKNTISFNRWIMVDPLQMEQVLINLLTNSLYALEANDEKIIEISATLKNKRLFISIADTGAGIDAEIEDKIFLPFFTTRKDGAGIGLTLSKNIMEAHGGYLNYQTDDNKTRFVMCLME